MTIKKVENIRDFPEVKEALDDIFNNLSPEDMRTGNFRTSVPTTKSIDKGRFAWAEISGVPTYFYRGTNGTIYKLFEGTAI